MATRRSDWLAGLVVGVFGGLVTLVFLPLGALGMLIFAWIAAAQPTRLIPWSGVLIGLGGGWTALLLRAVATCAEFDAVPGQDCVSPDVTGWLFAALALLLAGLAMLAAGLRRQ